VGVKKGVKRIAIFLSLLVTAFWFLYWGLDFWSTGDAVEYYFSVSGFWILLSLIIIWGLYLAVIWIARGFKSKLR
jgi:hypothetical protein